MLNAIWTKHTLKFKQPSGTSRGTLNIKESWFILLREEDNSSTVGIGECGLLKGLSHDDVPNYEEKLAKVCQNINKCAKDFQQTLLDFPSIRFGLEMALLDLKNGGTRNLFPSAFANGKQPIPINGLIWMGSKQFMFDQINTKINAGFDCIKLKIGAINFEEELGLLRYIRSEFSDIEIRVDANGAFQPDSAMNKLEHLAQFNIHSIEQPIAAGQQKHMARLCERSPIPIALDEELIGIKTESAKKQLLEKIRPQYIILKPSLVGGFASCAEYINLCNSLNIDWWATSALESNIGLNAIAQWTAIQNNDMPQGLGTGQLYTNNLPSPLEIQSGSLKLNTNSPWKIEPITSDGVITILGRQYSKDQIENLKCDHPDIGDFVESWLNNSDHLKLQTSGSTGIPQIISVSKNAVAASAAATIEYFDLRQNETILLCLPTNFVAGQMILARAIEGKLNVVPMSTSSNPAKEIQTPIRFAAMTPLQVFNGLEENPEKFDLINTLIIGGGPVNNELESKLIKIKTKCFVTYGMTETISHIALRHITPSNSKTYTALPGIKFKTDDRNCLVIRANRIREEEIVTNDIVELIDQQSFNWLGRFDNIVNSGGIKFNPEALEQKIGPLVRLPFIIIGVPDPKLGQKLAIVFETDQNQTSYIQTDITTIRNQVTRIEQPRLIFQVNSFSRTENGKIQRQKTIEQAQLVKGLPED